MKIYRLNSITVYILMRGAVCACVFVTNNILNLNDLIVDGVRVRLFSLSLSHI